MLIQISLESVTNGPVHKPTLIQVKKNDYSNAGPVYTWGTILNLATTLLIEEVTALGH